MKSKRSKVKAKKVLKVKAKQEPKKVVRSNLHAA